MSPSTLSPEKQDSIRCLLNTMPRIAKGVGTKEEACSIAAINLALTGELTDRIPDCMSEVIGQWIITIQDAMPADVRNSARWRGLLPHAAGTGRDSDKERLRADRILGWLWKTILTSIQPVADKRGFGDAWKAMTDTDAAYAAAYAAAADAAAYAARAATATARAAYAAYAAAYAAAAYAADATAYAATADAAFWKNADPCSLLETLINV